MGRVKISLFGALAKITGDNNIDVEALTLKDAIDLLTAKYGESFKDRIYDEKDTLRRFVNIYINGKDIRFLNRLNTNLNEGDTVSIVPAVGGG